MNRRTVPLWVFLAAVAFALGCAVSTFRRNVKLVRAEHQSELYREALAAWGVECAPVHESGAIVCRGSGEAYAFGFDAVRTEDNQ
jgi:hypothetical protein